jgi:DNA-directed RNA polymerase specialized sigma24 family protein
MKGQIEQERESGGARGNGHAGRKPAHLSTRGKGGAKHLGPADELEMVYRWYSKDLLKQARRWGFSLEDAEDLTQEFFLRLAVKDSLETFDSAKGEFRSFLLTLFQRFLSNHWHSVHTLRRGGANVTVPLSVLLKDCDGLVDWKTPVKMAELHWAREMLEHALRTMRNDLVRRGKGKLFQKLLPELLHQSDGHGRGDNGKNGHAGRSQVAFRMTVSRYRQRLRSLICRELGDDPVNGHAEELKSLLEMLGT